MATARVKGLKLGWGLFQNGVRDEEEGQGNQHDHVSWGQEKLSGPTKNEDLKLSPAGEQEKEGGGGDTSTRQEGEKKESKKQKRLGSCEKGIEFHRRTHFWRNMSIREYREGEGEEVSRLLRVKREKKGKRLLLEVRWKKTKKMYGWTSGGSVPNTSAGKELSEWKRPRVNKGGRLRKNRIWGRGRGEVN